MTRLKCTLIGLVICVGLVTIVGCTENNINRFVSAARENEKTEKWKKEYLIASVEPEQEISFLEMDVTDLEIVLNKGEQSKYEILSDQEDVETEDFFSIEEEKSRLHIKTIHTNKTSPKLKVVVYTSSLEQMKVDMKSEDCVFVINSSLSELNLNANNSVISLEGEETYPISVDIKNTVLGMKFQTVNAIFSLDVEDSMVSLPEGNSIMVSKRYQDTKKFGKGASEMDVTAKSSVIEVTGQTAP